MSESPNAAGAVAAPDWRPELTFPPAETRLLREAYAMAHVILEYGSGGSTVIAAGDEGRRVFSVESDRDWAGRMADWFRSNPPAGKASIHYVDIGPTGDWGTPESDRFFRRWPSYPLSVWDREDFAQPDLVLIDGRFRPACFFTTMFRTKAPVTVLWDDYRDRPEYHLVEEFCAPTAMIGRMAVFDVAPMAIPADRLGLILSTFLRVK